MLKYTDLINDRIYFCNYSGFDSIFKFNSSNPEQVYYLNLRTNSFSKSSWSFYSNYLENTRETTKEESIWMEMCISKNQFIPFEDIAFSNKELEIEIW